MINSPLQKSIHKIETKIETMNFNQKSTIENIKNTISQLERIIKQERSDSKGSSGGNQENSLYENKNKVSNLHFDYSSFNKRSDLNESNSEIRGRRRNNQDTNDGQIEKESHNQNHNQNSNWNYDNKYNNTYNSYGNYNDLTNEVKKKTLKTSSSNLNLNSIRNEIEHLKIQISSLERKENEDYTKENKKNQSNFNISQENYLNSLSDKEILNEIKGIFDEDVSKLSNADLIYYIKTSLFNNKRQRSLNDDFVDKTMRIYERIIKPKHKPEIIPTWRWLKNVISDWEEYNEVKEHVRKRFSLSETKKIKKVIIKCVDHTYSNKLKFGKIKKILLTEPNSRNESKE